MGCYILINKVMSMKNKIIVTVKHLSKRLFQSPLLVGWIIIGTIIEIIRNGYQAFEITIINLILLALFTVIIKMMTVNSSVKLIPKLNHPRLELFSGTLLYIFIVIEASVVWRQSKIPYINSGIINLISSIETHIYKLSRIGIADWFLPMLSNTLVVIVLVLIPTIILFVFGGTDLERWALYLLTYL